MQSGHHHCLYAQLLEEDVQVSLEKAAVAGTIALARSHVSEPVTKSLSMSTTRIAGFSNLFI